MNKLVGTNGLILGAFALVTTSLIAITYAFTDERIEQAKERQLLGTLNQVVSEQMHDNELHLDCINVSPHELLGGSVQRVFRSRLQGRNTALVIETTAVDGYSGNIDLVVAIDTNHTVLGARVIDHRETPGLGDKIELRISDWILGFENKKFSDGTLDSWQVKKDGGQFDQFTGATITPRAVVNAVKSTAIYGHTYQDQLFSSPSNCLSDDVVQIEALTPFNEKEQGITSE